jgi:hypothetical protein
MPTSEHSIAAPKIEKVFFLFNNKSSLKKNHWVQSLLCLETLITLNARVRAEREVMTSTSRNAKKVFIFINVYIYFVLICSPDLISGSSVLSFPLKRHLEI